MPLASIVVCTIDGHLPRLRRLIRGVLRHTVIRHELIVVDGATTDDTARWLRSVPRVCVVRLEKKPTDAIGANAGFAVARGKYVAKLDTDTVVRGRGWLRSAIRVLERNPKAAIAGDVWRAGRGVTSWIKGREDTSRIEPEWWSAVPRRASLLHVQGSAMVFVGTMLRELDGFNENYQHDFTDVELSWLALSRGWVFARVPCFCCSDNAERLRRRVRPWHKVIHPCKEVSE